MNRQSCELLLLQLSQAVPNLVRFKHGWLGNFWKLKVLKVGKIGKLWSKEMDDLGSSYLGQT